jgi:hypothetical protein
MPEHSRTMLEQRSNSIGQMNHKDSLAKPGFPDCLDKTEENLLYNLEGVFEHEQPVKHDP